jgi:hypothetical protein
MGRKITYTQIYSLPGFGQDCGRFLQEVRRCGMAEKSVDGYIASLEPWQADIARKVRRIVGESAPHAQETFKWAQPVYEMNGPFAYLKAFKSAVNFGFWRGADLKDPLGLLQGSGEKMRHVKLSNPDEIDAAALADFVKQAVELNRERGDPTKGS